MTAIVIPNWNGARLLKPLLARLSSQSRAAERVIVVDDGSTDDSCALAAGAGAEVITLGINSGFSRAVNAGIRAAQV